MLGHYLFFWILVHEDVILWSGCIVNRLYKMGVIESPITHFSVFFPYIDPENYIEHSQYFEWVDDMKIRIWHIPAVLLTWLSVKYHYYLSFEVLIFTSVLLLRSLTMFYSLLCAGVTGYMISTLPSPMIYSFVHIFQKS